MNDDERRKLVSTEQSLASDPEPKMPSSISGLETFSLTDDDDEPSHEPILDADSFFNLPNESGYEDEQP
jgi:hypothetical protein